MRQAATSQELRSWLLLSQTLKPVALAQMPSPRKLLPQSVPKKSLKRQAEGWGVLTELGFSWELFQPRQEVLGRRICASVGLSSAVSPPMLTHKGVPPGTHWLPENGVCYQRLSWGETVFSSCRRVGVYVSLQHAQDLRELMTDKISMWRRRWG